MIAAPSLATRFGVVADGLAAAVRLLGVAWSSLLQRDGSFVSRLAAGLTGAEGLRLVCTFARAFVPNIKVSRSFVAAYDNSGTALVTRYDDVKDVLSRDDDFEVVYGARMTRVTAGQNFILGMQDGPDYRRDLANLRRAVRPGDVAARVQPFACRHAAALVAAAPGLIDVPQDLTLRVPSALLDHYFGTPGPSERTMIDWTAVLFWYLFIDLDAEPGLDAHALDAARQCRAYLDNAIAARKAYPTPADDVLNRCLAMQRDGTPGMDDAGIRSNLIGLLIGLVPTLSKAAVLALDHLLDHPDAMAGACRAAVADDDATLGRYVFEALRFNPFSPVTFRRAVREVVIAPGTRRAITVPKSTMVFAANLSATFDPLKIVDPAQFRTDRPADNYIAWGDGLHACFGAQINQAVIPAMLKPLLAKPGLRRAAGPLGQIATEGTPFPVHLWLQFGAASV